MSYTYKYIVQKAKNTKKSVETQYKLGEGTRWSYYYAQAILTPKKDIKTINFDVAPKPSGSYISNQMKKSDFIKLAKFLIQFVKNHKRLPNYIRWGNYRVGVKDYTYMLARVLVYYNTNKKLPLQANINSKAFTKPHEYAEDILEYFEKVFGKISCFDDALDKINDRGYSYYYDDRYSNKETIDRVKKYLGVNCTDITHVLTNVGRGLILRDKKYKAVDAVHVLCSGGDGHIRNRITMNNGDTFYRDGACTLSDGGYCNWCTQGYTLLAVNPSWFMANLNR